ncbi:hypothetical protein CRUP_022789, partial [Coryphaenoides rupestris]
MKLELSRVVRGGCRLGVLREVGRAAQASLEVPGCLLYTRSEHWEVLEEYKDGFKKFAGLHDTALYCSLHDPVTPCPTVSVWGSGGRLELTVSRFMALQKALRPDLPVDRTLAHLDACLTIHQQTPELQGAEVLGVVEGGDNLDERLRSARETAKRPVGGFCLDGFQTGAMERSLRTRLIAAVARELPEDKPRLAQSPHCPSPLCFPCPMGRGFVDIVFVV